MLISRTQLLATAAVVLSALTPAAANAAGVHSHPVLTSSPQMILVDAHHATLRFAAQRIGRTRAGAVDATITYADGSRAYGTRPVGTHGTDIVYDTHVASKLALSDHERFTVGFRLGRSGTVHRIVKLYASSELQPGPAGASARATRRKGACTEGPKLPCSFSTPAANIRCLWTPSPNNVACELLSTGRAYRLSPTGKAKRIHLKLTRRGDTLPTNQQVVFPDSLSCRDTKATMICNQDFGFGAFTLAAKGSTSS